MIDSGVRMTAKEDLHRLVDRLANSELEKAREMLEHLNVELDDDTFEPEELAEIEEGSAQIDRGEYVTLEEFKRKRHS
jgi:predicted transcriptional regulator